MMPKAVRQTLSPILVLIALWIAGCSGTGPEVVDPDAEDRTQTALLAVAQEGASEIARYYEVDGLVESREYETANDRPLDLQVDAIYERDDQLWLHSNASGTIAILDLDTREEVGRIDNLPTGDEGHLNGMAFSNLSQAWAIAYGSQMMFHIDARNHVKVRDIELQGEPTGISTVDNRVFIGLEMADGSGSIARMYSNDPDFQVIEVLELDRPPVVMNITPDNEFLIAILPGDSIDNPETGFIDTDPTMMVIDLIDNEVRFEQRIVSPPLLEQIGRHPTFASATLDFFIYLATSDGLLRVDTKAWGEVINLLPGASYDVVGAEYWTDLVYAVPSDNRMRVARIDKDENRLDDIELSGEVRDIRFVSTNKVSR